jgi:hypothetical protein
VPRIAASETAKMQRAKILNSENIFEARTCRSELTQNDGLRYLLRG